MRKCPATINGLTALERELDELHLVEEALAAAIAARLQHDGTRFARSQDLLVGQRIQWVRWRLRYLADAYHFLHCCR